MQVELSETGFFQKRALKWSFFLQLSSWDKDILQQWKCFFPDKNILSRQKYFAEIKIFCWDKNIPLAREHWGTAIMMMMRGQLGFIEGRSRTRGSKPTTISRPPLCWSLALGGWLLTLRWFPRLDAKVVVCSLDLLLFLPQRQPQPSLPVEEPPQPWKGCHLCLGEGEAQVAELSHCLCSTDCRKNCDW